MLHGDSFIGTGAEMRITCLSLIVVGLISGCGEPPVVRTCDAASRVVVTDIDETLTTSDAEWMSQVSDPVYDPAMRPDANTLMQTYWDLGYTIVYITARGDAMTLSDGRSSTEATADWLIAHDFPLEDDALYLAEGIGAIGSGAVTYKSEVIADLEATGWEMAWAYGNADSDIEAFQLAGIPDDQIFLVGELAGEMGVQPIVDEEAYTQHLGAHVASLACAGD